MMNESPMELIDQLLTTNSKSEWLAISKKLATYLTEAQRNSDLEKMMAAGLLPQA